MKITIITVITTKTNICRRIKSRLKKSFTILTQNRFIIKTKSLTNLTTK